MTTLNCSIREPVLRVLGVLIIIIIIIIILITHHNRCSSKLLCKISAYTTTSKSGGLLELRNLERVLVATGVHTSRVPCLKTTPGVLPTYAHTFCICEERTISWPYLVWRASPFVRRNVTTITAPIACCYRAMSIDRI